MNFQSFGEEILDTIADFAERASTLLIDELQIPVLTCLTIYFLIKGYLIAYGRIDSPLSDFILTAGKILLVTYFGFNSLHYVQDVIPAIRGFENMLIGVIQLPGQADVSTGGAWAAIDEMWKQLMQAYNLATGLLSGVSFISAFGTWASLFVLSLLMAIIAVGLTFAATGVLIVNEISLVITLAFGPLFICCLMFPVTRSWFDGWIKAVATYLFSSIFIAAVILLITGIFEVFLGDLVDDIRNYQSGRSLMTVWLPVLKFTVLGLALTSLTKLVPSIAAAIVGGVALQAVGLGQMMTSSWQTGRGMVGGFVDGMGKGVGSTEMQTYAREHYMSRDGYGDNGVLGAGLVGAGFGSAYHVGRFIMSSLRSDSASLSMLANMENTASGGESRVVRTTSAAETMTASAAGATAGSTSGSAPNRFAESASAASSPTQTTQPFSTATGISPTQETPEQTMARFTQEAAIRNSERLTEFTARDAAVSNGQPDSSSTSNVPASQEDAVARSNAELLQQRIQEKS